MTYLVAPLEMVAFLFSAWSPAWRHKDMTLIIESWLCNLSHAITWEYGFLHFCSLFQLPYVFKYGLEAQPHKISPYLIF